MNHIKSQPHLRKSSYLIVCAEYRNHKYLLLGREAHNHLWCGFGGGLEQNESYEDALGRECWEESLGLLGEPDEIISKARLITPKTCVKQYYTMNMKYNKELPSIYKKVYDFILKCGKNKLESHCSEKDMIQWFRVDKLMNEKDIDPYFSSNYTKYKNKLF